MILDTLTKIFYAMFFIHAELVNTNISASKKDSAIPLYLTMQNWVSPDAKVPLQKPVCSSFVLRRITGRMTPITIQRDTNFYNVFKPDVPYQNYS